MGFLKLKAVRENRERRRPVKEEYGLIFDGSPTFAHLSKMDDNQVYQLFLSDKTAPDDTPVNMTGVPPDYHEFTDVFSKTHTSAPAPHWPYDLKIELEEGTSPPFGPIYSLSQSELKSLQEFLDEHLPIPFARQSSGSVHTC